MYKESYLTIKVLRVNDEYDLQAYYRGKSGRVRIKVYNWDKLIISCVNNLTNILNLNQIRESSLIYIL